MRRMILPPMPHTIAADVAARWDAEAAAWNELGLEGQLAFLVARERAERDGRPSPGIESFAR